MKSRSPVIAAALLALAALATVAAAPLAAQDGGAPPPAEDPGADYPEAPEFPEGLRWWNSGRPLRMADLRGHVVILDFWTFCCINCIHALDELAALEAKYADQPFVVVGIHSPKFENEKNADNIRSALLRYDIEHPVVVDSGLKLWKKYGARSWPTLVAIDAKGRVRDFWKGEGNLEAMDAKVAELLAEGRAQGALADERIALDAEAIPAPQSGLLFPGKLLADAEGGRLFIADSGHDRILVCDLAGKVTDVIGRGQPGLTDGPFEKARLRDPQGLLLLDGGKKLLVADTGNHALREVDLQARTVRRVAGTGELNPARRAGTPGLETGLNSPWALAAAPGEDGLVYVAMAGPHQIWTFDRESGIVNAFSGSGREARIDGPHPEAGFAQPSGLATDGKVLYVADSEISCIRAVDLAPDGEVRTVCGGDLFEFGDVDGKGDAVRLQHPLGVALADGTLYVADTYNHKLKKVSPKDGAATGWVGGGGAGYADGAPDEARFYHPGGLSVAGETLFVADTNNHLVRTVALKTGRTRTLRLDFTAVADRTGPNGAPPADAAPPDADTVATEEPALVLAPGAQTTLALSAAFADGWKYNDLDVVRWTARLSGGAAAFVGEGDGARRAGEAKAFPITLALRAADAPAEGPPTAVIVTLGYTYCSEGDQAVCLPRSRRFVVPIRIAKDAEPAEKRDLVDEVAAPQED